MKKLKNIIINLLNNIKLKIKTSFIKCKNGEEKLNTLLIYWCLIPCILYLLSLRFLNCKIILNIFDIILFILCLLDLYFIAKTLKLHPEYNTELMEEIKKQEYLKTLTEEQIKEEKLKESKQAKIDFVKRILALKAGKKVDNYKIVKYFVILTFLIVLKRIFL